MESQGTYQADASADETRDDATPEKVVPLRPYTKVYNDYYEALIGVVSPSAYYVLHYLIRQTCGFHRDATRSSLSVIADATNLSRHTVITALRELQDMHIVTSDGDTLTRTQIRTYQMQPADSWQLPSKTSAKIALVEKRKRTSAKIAHDDTQTSADNALDDTSTSAKIAPIKRKPERKGNQRKENQTDATASAERGIASASLEKPSRQKPKLSGEALERHQAEAAYISDLVKRLRDHLHGAKLPNDKQERAAGHWFYTAGKDEMPADPEQVMACYAVVKHAPFWSGRFLSLQSLKTFWPEWMADPAQVKRTVADERRKNERGRTASQNGRENPANRETPYTTADQAAPKGWE